MKNIVLFVLSVCGLPLAHTAELIEGKFDGFLPDRPTLIVKGCRPEQIELTDGLTAGDMMRPGLHYVFCHRRACQGETIYQAQVAEGACIKFITVHLTAAGDDVEVSGSGAKYLVFKTAEEAKAMVGKIDTLFLFSDRGKFEYSGTAALAVGEKAPGYGIAGLTYRIHPSDRIPAVTRTRPVVQVSIDKNPAVFRCGENATFTIAVKPRKQDGKLAGQLAFEISDFELDTVPECMTVSLKTATVFRIARTLRKPGFLKLRVEDGFSPPSDPWTAAFSPEKIRKGSPLPKDFASWWRSELARAEREVPLDPQMTLAPERSRPEFNMYRVSFATFGRRIYGTLSIPTKRGRHQLNVQIASHGFADFANFGGTSPNEAMLWFSVFPFRPDWEWRKLNIRADFEAMKREHNEKWGVTWERAGLGSTNRTDYFFHPVIIGASRAVDWLAKRDDIDGKDIVYNGGSQGGGLGMMLVAVNGHFRKAVFGVPGLVDTMGWLAGHESGWPKAFESRPRNRDEEKNYLANMPYYDAANFCTMIQCPVWINMGMRDRTIPPTAIVAAFNNLSTKEKSLDYEFDCGHGTPDHIAAKRAQWLRAK